MLSRQKAKQHEARHYKKVGFSAFAAAMLCMGVTAQAATITVNSSAGTLTDGGNCTLRGAVSSINSGSNQNGCAAVVSLDAYGINDTITFDTAVFSAATTIPVSPQIEILNDLTIDGPLDVDDAPLITLDGNNANRILNVPGAVSVLTVSGLAFQYGSGSAIYAYSTTANVSNSTFKNNQTGDDGGAISAFTANVSNSTFEGNQATSYGGAIHASTANVSNSTFEGNHTDGTGGAIDVYGTANVSDSTFKNNWANGIGGGAIFNYGTVNVSNSTFKGNRVNNNNGGAISAGTAHVSNSTFEGNQANNGNGGAIRAGTALRASHLTLLDNSAKQNGAAIYVYNNGNGIINNSLILSSVALVDAPTLCAVDGTGSLGGSYNIEWVNGTDTTSCGGSNNISGGSGAIGAIVETTLADNGGPTPTLALPAGSPAIGAVDPGGATSRMLVIDFSQTTVTATWEDATLDQRGIARAAAAADRSIGAFEKAPPAPIPVLPAPLALLLALGVAGIGFRKLKVARS